MYKCNSVLFSFLSFFWQRFPVLSFHPLKNWICSNMTKTSPWIAMATENLHQKLRGFGIRRKFPLYIILPIRTERRLCRRFSSRERSHLGMWQAVCTCVWMVWHIKMLATIHAKYSMVWEATFLLRTPYKYFVSNNTSIYADGSPLRTIFRCHSPQGTFFFW